ncbi:GlxA family transcriptional regulator [Nitrosococcus wardiae]|uniref:Helix-turn-helix domain-containing protein n=1 Tax=Nitrosococcus wardiae TaxID=1814290 RepID=A0A4V1AW60_9GAMM|nr:helix-turn-helix domain-containing protein [Nitrosococcus wardiae]QBQ55505.1 helix-turn-helix domain-containing protein [Nitrosococcus wardiae]
MSTAPVNIAILVFPETTGSVVYGMYDLFLSAGRDWSIVTEGRPSPELIRPLLVAKQQEPFAAGNGVHMAPHTTMAQCPENALICVPEVNLPPGASLASRYHEEISWLKQRYAEGAVLASACSGAMLFAEAGLLDGCEATTHWAWCDVMRHRFPKTKVHPQRALVVSGEGQRLVMAGGGTSWLDLALYLIARTVGLEPAMQVARVNLIDWHNIGQQPFARLARTRQVEDAVIAHCQIWIAEHYQEHNPVNAMVRLSGLAERTFKRRFQQATGMSPLEYVHALRLEEAKQMLEASDLPIENIANEVGYEDAAFFSRLFRRKVNLTPAQYRKRFGALRKSLSST